MAARQSSKGSTSQAKRSGATTRKKRAAKSRAALPGWLWGIAGLVAGFFLAQYVQQSAPPPLATVLTKPSGSAAEPSGQDQEAAEEPRMPTFEFYTLLPESEVIAPRSDATDTPPPKPAAATASDPIAELARQHEAKQAPSGESPPPSAADDHRYVLQAASFREPGDAQRLAGRLKDFGLLARISEVKAGDGNTWHRVQVGPYGDSGELNRAQDLMITQGIEPLMIRLQN